MTQGMRTATLALTIALTTCRVATAEQRPQLVNPHIDAKGYLADVNEAVALRADRQVSEDEFIAMSRDPGTVILDARSLRRYEQMHVKGAVHLNFADMTAAELARLVPSKDTRILLYCNNNIADQPIAFATKAFASPLNLPTFSSLYSYGYRNVYELGELVETRSSKIVFEGTLVKPETR